MEKLKTPTHNLLNELVEYMEVKVSMEINIRKLSAHEDALWGHNYRERIEEAALVVEKTLDQIITERVEDILESKGYMKEYEDE